MTSLINRIFRKKIQSPVSPSRMEPELTSELPEEEGPVQQIDISPQENSSRKLHIDLAQLSVGVAHSIGIQRDGNEDALFTLASNLVAGEKELHFGFFVVADGMGGHENGEIASCVAVEKLVSYVVGSYYLPLFSDIDKMVPSSIQEIMHAGVLHAHQKVKIEAVGGGSTVTAILILGDQMTVAHVGDSRAYMVTPEGSLRELTQDHSLVKRLIDIGQITPEQAAFHPQRNVLYRALGQGDALEPDIATYQLEPGSQLVLCTDGLWGVITENELLDVIHSHDDPQEACQALVHMANSAGGPDNISVILVRIPQ